MAEEKKSTNFGSSRTDVFAHEVGTLERILGRQVGEEEGHMRFSDASWDNHLTMDPGINRKLFRELGGISCFRLDACYSSYSCQSLAYEVNADRYALRFSSMENSKYLLFQMEKPRIEVSVQEIMVDFYAPMLTKSLENDKDMCVCICQVSWEDFGFCCQIDEQCAPELTGNDLDCSRINKKHTIATKRLFMTVKSVMDKRSTGLKDVYIRYITEEASGSALKEMNGKTLNGAARTSCPNHNMTLLRPSSHEPPDVG